MGQLTCIIRLQSRYWPYLLFHQKAQLGEDPFPTVVQIQFPVGYSTGGHSSSLAVDLSFLSCEPLHNVVHLRTVSFP